MTEPKPTVTDADLSTMLVLSVRYALGRRTTVVLEARQLVERYHHLLLPADHRTMIKDIRRQEQLGWSADYERETWAAVLALLEGEKAP